MTNQITDTNLTWTVTPATLAPGADTSLADLRQIKDRWIAQAEELKFFESCRRIARELGERCEAEFRYPWDQHAIYRWQYEAVTILLITDVGGQYLVSQKAFEERDRLIVTVAGQRVASYIFTNHPHPDRNEYLFVPGSWTLPIQAHAQEAQEHAARRAMDAQENERQALLAELLVGVDI